MVVADQILSYVQNMPESLQNEILDFVEFVAAKRQNRDTDENEIDSARLQRIRQRLAEWLLQG